MKKILFLILLFPMIAVGEDMANVALSLNTRGLPQDFRQYFYNSEVMVQVYLNDSHLFDASITLKESGKIRLIQVIDTNDTQNIDADTRARWIDVLQDGVSVGQCFKDCPSGLMEVQYQLSHSILKLYTANYETSRVKSEYISVPGSLPSGVIMYNDASVTSTSSSRNWGINSSLMSSLAGWNQKVSFQSSGTDKQSSSSLYELYSQKELRGSFLRLGFFTPEMDSSNVSISGFSYNTVIGAMWGTSDTLLINRDSVSRWPVYVTGRNQSIAEVWRDGRLIYTQQLQSGVQALDTRRLPDGIYDISIKIIENGQTIDTQQAQIYKPQGWHDSDKRWRMNLWSGQSRSLSTGYMREGESNGLAIGGSVDILAHPRAIVGLSGMSTDREHAVKVQSSITLSADDTLFSQYTLGNAESHRRREMDIRYYRNIVGGSSGSLFWRSAKREMDERSMIGDWKDNIYGGSLSMRLPWSMFLNMNSQYMDTDWRRGFGTEISVSSLRTMIWGRNTNFRLSAYNLPVYGSNRRDQGLSLNVSVELVSGSRHSVSAESGLENNKGYFNLNYQWAPETESRLRLLGAGVSYSPWNTVISGNAAVDSAYVSGDAYVQHDTQGKTTMVGGNISQALVMGGGQVVSVSGNNSRSMESALIVDVDADEEDVEVLASSSMSEVRLSAGRNIVGTELWKKDTVQFLASGNESVKVMPERDSVQMGRGSVRYIKVKAVKTLTIIGMLRDEGGKVLRNRYVKSDVSGRMINGDGVLTLDVGMRSRTLRVRSEDGLAGLLCELPADMDRSKEVRFIHTIPCRVDVTGDNE